MTERSRAFTISDIRALLAKVTEQIRQLDEIRDSLVLFVKVNAEALYMITVIDNRMSALRQQVDRYHKLILEHETQRLDVGTLYIDGLKVGP